MAMKSLSAKKYPDALQMLALLTYEVNHLFASKPYTLIEVLGGGHLVGGGMAAQHGVVVHIIGVVGAPAHVVRGHQHVVEVCLRRSSARTWVTVPCRQLPSRGCQVSAAVSCYTVTLDRTPALLPLHSVQ